MAIFIPVSLFITFVALFGPITEAGLLNRLAMAAIFLQAIPLLVAPLAFPTHKCVQITKEELIVVDSFFGVASFRAVIGGGTLSKREVRSLSLFRAGELLNDVAVMRVTPKFGTSTDIMIPPETSPEQLAQNLCEFGYEISMSNWTQPQPAVIPA